MIVAVMQTVIVPLISDLPAMLHTSGTGASWALTITLLVAALTTPIAGRLGDMYGKRRVMVLEMACVAVGSAICAVVSTIVPFVVGRGLQGAGIGVIAVGISILRDIAPATRLGASVGVLNASIGVGGALGLPVAAVIAEHLSWRALFWTCGVVAASAFAALLLLVPESSVRTGGKFDIVGAIGFGAAFTCLLVPLAQGAQWAWTSPVTVGFLAAFVVIGGAWWQWEKRASSPLIDLSIVVQKPIMLTNLVSAATGFAFYAFQIAPIQLLMAPPEAPGGVGLSMVLASLVMTPVGVVMFVSSSTNGRVLARFGPRRPIFVGMAVVSAGYLVFLAALVGKWHVGAVSVMVAGALIGAGLGTVFSSMPALIMQLVPQTQTGEANGVNALLRNIGTSSSTAVVGMVLTASTVTVRWSGGEVEHPTTGAFTAAAIIVLAVCAAAFACAVAIPRSRVF
nr:MFS transporter [Gordonia humi]